METNAQTPKPIALLWKLSANAAMSDPEPLPVC
jgi:hypothetical protein